MTFTTRLALLILTVGFVIEGIGEASEFLQRSFLSGQLIYFYYVGPSSTVIGFLCAFVGRHEWSELHRKHVLHAHRVLALAIVLLGSVIGTIFVMAVYFPTTVIPVALPWGLGIAAAVGLGSSFVSYLLIAYHLTSVRGKVFLAAALVWAAVVSALTGYFLASNLGQVITAIHKDPTSLAQALNALTFVTTILFVSYFLLTLAYHDAYRQLKKGVLPPGHTPAVRPDKKEESAPPSASSS